MKLLHVNIAHSGGGLEQYLAQLFQELNKRGHMSVFLYSENGHASLSLPQVKTFCVEGITQLHCANLYTKLKMVKEIIDRENPDLIYIHQVLNSPLIDFITNLKPSVRFVHGFKLVCPDGRKTHKTKDRVCESAFGYSCQFYAYLYRCMPRNPLTGIPLIHHAKKISKIHRKRSYMVAPSEYMRSLLIANGFEENRIAVIPYFTYLPELNTEVAEPNEPVVLSLGRIVQGKGMDYLIRAFAAGNKKTQLVIVGDGPELNALKLLARDLGVFPRVTFTGWLSHKDLDNFYRKCSLVLVPSICPESFGIVGIEAMAYQKPVIAFDVGGISEWLKEGETGFLVNRGDEAGLTERINFVLNRPDLAQEMGKKGRAMVKSRFTANAHLQLLIPLFEKAIDDSLG